MAVLSIFPAIEEKEKVKVKEVERQRLQRGGQQKEERWDRRLRQSLHLFFYHYSHTTYLPVTPPCRTETSTSECPAIPSPVWLERFPPLLLGVILHVAELISSRNLTTDSYASSRSVAFSLLYTYSATVSPPPDAS